MRMMQQYGFVLPGGNPADRIAFSALDTERCCSEDLFICSVKPTILIHTCEDQCILGIYNSLGMQLLCLCVGVTDIRVVA